MMHGYDHVTDDDIIRDIKRIACKLNSNALSEEQYCQNGGKYPLELICEFGGFHSRCELAGLKAKQNDTFNIFN